MDDSDGKEGEFELGSLEAEYAELTSAVNGALEVLPRLQKVRGKVRTRSARSIELFEAREKEFSGATRGTEQWSQIVRRY